MSCKNRKPQRFAPICLCAIVYLIAAEVIKKSRNLNEVLQLRYMYICTVVCTCVRRCFSRLRVATSLLNSVLKLLWNTVKFNEWGLFLYGCKKICMCINEEMLLWLVQTSAFHVCMYVRVCINCLLENY